MTDEELKKVRSIEEIGWVRDVLIAGIKTMHEEYLKQMEATDHATSEKEFQKLLKKEIRARVKLLSAYEKIVGAIGKVVDLDSYVDRHSDYNSYYMGTEDDTTGGGGQ